MHITAPVYHDIDTINIVQPEKVILDNGIPLYRLNAGVQDIIKITLLFDAGSRFQPAPLVAFSANNLLTEGSQHYTAVQISEMNDFYGSYITCSTDKDSATVTLLTLRKYLDKTLPLLEDILKRPVYPEPELDTFKKRHSQQFRVEQLRNANIAHKKFVKALFGDTHPYGYELQLADFDNLHVDQLKTFYAGFYHPANCKIIVSGKVCDEDIRMINDYLGDQTWKSGTPANVPGYFFSEATGYRQKIEKPGSLQSSLRIGKQVCNKLHEDFAGLTVVNTILGGYFGSRLMRNLREDKAYTYGINSLLISLRNAGYITIITDVGAEVAEAALHEIYSEIERLQAELVPDDELQMVRTHLMSEMLRSFDGPFAQAESLIALLEYDLENSYYENFVNRIKTIDAKEIRNLAQQYLDIQRIYEIVVG